MDLRAIGGTTWVPDTLGAHVAILIGNCLSMTYILPRTRVLPFTSFPSSSSSSGFRVGSSGNQTTYIQSFHKHTQTKRKGVRRGRRGWALVCLLLLLLLLLQNPKP